MTEIRKDLAVSAKKLREIETSIETENGKLLAEEDIIKRMESALSSILSVDEEIAAWRIEALKAGKDIDEPIPQELLVRRTRKIDYETTLAASRRLVAATNARIDRLKEESVALLEDARLKATKVLNEYASALGDRLEKNLEENKQISMELLAIFTNFSSSKGEYFSQKLSKLFNTQPIIPSAIYNSLSPLEQEFYKERRKAVTTCLNDLCRDENAKISPSPRL
ncbi:hypothetical protein [Acetobacter tropicalis]|uniref:Uncharacterized protein n=1 Tax=Acetobacter tropicalis TaxID=104102 RepID=A0A252AAN9_9PROT|nr:hypothetical protein [Acetobacter tropicalis]OUI86605.1 hypothetical protein HC62_04075 [Acetobacter tropicalis]